MKLNDRVELVAEDDPARGERGTVEEVHVAKRTKEISVQVKWDHPERLDSLNTWEDPENLRVLQYWEVAEERGQQRLFGLSRGRRRR